MTNNQNNRVVSSYRKRGVNSLSGLAPKVEKTLENDTQPQPGSTFTDTSPIDGRQLTWRIEEATGKDLQESFYKSHYNLRARAKLTKDAVEKILPGIAESGRNSRLAVCFRDQDGNTEILEGCKRAYCVEITPGAVFRFIVCDELTPKERKHFAKISDQYDAPSLLDIGESLIELQAVFEQRGKKLSDREAAIELGVSKGNASEAKNAALIEGLWELFPHLGAVTRLFARKVLKYKSTISKGMFDDLDPVRRLADESDEELSARVKTLEDTIMQILAPKTVKAEQVFSTMAGISASEKGKTLTIKVDTKLVSPKIKEQILKLIEQ